MRTGIGVSLIFAVALAPACKLALATEPPQAQEIIARSDGARNPKTPFRTNLRLTEYISGVPRNEIVLIVYSKLDDASGQFKNLVRYFDPPRDRGKAVLMNGTVMWFYDPSSRTSVRISPEARLIGQASDGDVVTANLARDYAAKLVGAPDGETIEDADRKPRRCWHLALSPIHEDAIYGRMEYWVEKETYKLVKAKFYTDSGRLLKIAYYHKYEQTLGVTRPSETIIIDAVNSKLVTTMNFSEYQARDVPDRWYQREYLPRIKSDQ